MLTLEFENGTLDVTEEGLRNMKSEYFNALLSSDMKKNGKIEDVYVEDFKMMYEIKEWKEVASKGSVIWDLEDWCNKLILADRFQMSHAFAIYFKKLAVLDVSIKMEFPVTVIELLLIHHAPFHFNHDTWAELICVDGLSLSIFKKYRDCPTTNALLNVVFDHPSCTSTIFGELFQSGIEKRRIYEYARRGLITFESALKYIAFGGDIGSSWTPRVKKGTSPVEIEMVTRCRFNTSSSYVYAIDPELKAVSYYEILDGLPNLVVTGMTEKEVRAYKGEGTIHAVI